jgi:hypothetical protein
LFHNFPSSNATGPNPRSAQLHSSAWPTSTAPARPMCTAHAAHDLPGRPRPVQPTTARRASAHRSSHRSPSTHRSAAGGGATVVEVEQRKVLEHPRRRGHLLGKWVEAIAHRGFSSTGRGGTGSAAMFSDEVRAPAVVLRRGGGGEEARLNNPWRKSGKRGGARGSAHRGGVRDGGGGRTAAVARLDSNVVIFRHGRRRGRHGRARGEATVWLGQRRGSVKTALPVGVFMAWRGRVAATRRWRADRRAQRRKRRLTGGPLMSAISKLNLLPDKNSSK